jgi:hypothetical protein
MIGGGYSMGRGKRCVNKKKKKIGFTNTFATYVLVFLFVTVFMGFYLALKSIEYNYIGSLVCFTAAIAPLDTMLSVVLGKVVDKNKAENIGGNGDGITFAAAQAAGFAEDYSKNVVSESPPI